MPWHSVGRPVYHLYERMVTLHDVAAQKPVVSTYGTFCYSVCVVVPSSAECKVSEPELRSVVVKPVICCVHIVLSCQVYNSNCE